LKFHGPSSSGRRLAIAPGATGVHLDARDYVRTLGLQMRCMRCARSQTAHATSIPPRLLTLFDFRIYCERAVVVLPIAFVITRPLIPASARRPQTSPCLHHTPQSDVRDCRLEEDKHTPVVAADALPHIYPAPSQYVRAVQVATAHRGDNTAGNHGGTVGGRQRCCESPCALCTMLLSRGVP
jgi:hypothetical protein